MEKCANEVRQDDCSRLRHQALMYIPNIIHPIHVSKALLRVYAVDHFLSRYLLTSFIMCTECSYIFIQCFRNIFTGPYTVEKGEPGMSPGKACIMQKYGIMSVTDIMIAYIASIVSSPITIIPKANPS